jgi:hypothetical protein
MSFLLKTTLIYPWKYYKVLLVMALFFGEFIQLFTLIPLAKAEGSRELVQHGGNRPYLLFGSDSNTAGIESQATLKVFVKAGEIVHLGSSMETQIDGNVDDIVYRWPSSNPPLVETIPGSGNFNNTGNGFFNVDGTTCGFISTIAQEAAGPFPSSGGYIPCSFQAQDEGVYEIEFHASDYLDTSNINDLPDSKLATEPFTTGIDQKIAISAWDITVIGTSGQAIPGRVYANYLPFGTKGANDEINSQLVILSKIGHQYQIALNGIQPIVFVLFANNKGFTDLSGQQLFKSVWERNAPTSIDSIETGEIKVHHPGTPDDSENITHKIFLNPPANDLPSSANTPGGGSTWLFSTPPNPPTVSNFTFTGIEGVLNQAGTTDPKGGLFSFKASQAGNYVLTIDVNQNGDFGDGSDRVLIGSASAGVNAVTWDGLDGQAVPNTLIIGVYQVKLMLSTNEVHFPFFDVENNPNGLIINRLTSCSGVCDVVYYDDSGYQINGNSMLEGENSSGGAHIFPINGFGNVKGIDTWTSIIAEPEESPLKINIKEVDLEVTKTHSPNNLFPGSEVTYTITVESKDGPFSDVTGIQVEDIVPNSIIGVTWTCTVAPVASGNNCAQTSGTGNINTIIDLKKGAIATFILQGIINSSLAGGDNIDNTVTITTPYDVTNLDGTTENADDPIILGAPLSQPPVANDDSTSTSVNTAITISVLDNDTAGENSLDKTSVTITTLPHDGTAQIIDGKVTYTPNTNFSGTDTFHYKVCNIDALCDLATVTVTIFLPLPPVANNDSASTLVNTALTISVLDNDTDDNNSLDETSVIVTTPPHNGIAQPTDGKVKYTPNIHFSGTDTFIYKVCDTEGLCNLATVTVTVIPPIPSDPSPVAEDIVTPTIINDKPVSLPPLTATDNGIIVSYIITTLPTDKQGILYLGNPTSDGIPMVLEQDLTPDQVDQLFFQPNLEFIGEASFTYRATDNVGGISNSAQVTITVQAPPSPPLANDDFFTNIKPNMPVILPILNNDSDPDGDLDPHSVIIEIPPIHGTGTAHPDGTITYLPQSGLTSGDDTLIYQVCDTGTPPQCDTATVTISILSVPNLPPVANNLLTPSTLNDTVVQLPALSAQDPDGIVIAYTIATLPLPTQGILHLGDPTKEQSELVVVGKELSLTQVGELFFQPDSHFIGHANFTYTATDNDKIISNSALVTIPVVQASPLDKPLNNSPLAQDDQATTAMNNAVTIAVLNNDYDPEDQLDHHQIQIISPPTNGDTTVNLDGTINYIPKLEFTGVDIFTYEVCDLGTPVQCDTARVTVNISLPPPPVAKDIVTPSTPNNVTITIALSAESNSNIIFYSIVTLPSPNQGTLYLNSHPTTPLYLGQILTPTEAENLLFQPNLNWVSEITFDYQATDVQSQVSNIATVTIPVTSPPDYEPQFSGKIWSSSGKVGKQLSIDAPEYIQVTGYIQPSLVHRGQLADILVIYHWTAYSGESTLTVPVTIASQQRLAKALMAIDLFEGYLIGLAGQIDVSLGYRINDELFSAPILTLTIHPNRTPAALTLSHQTVFEFSPTDTLVGSFLTEDPDNQEQFRYSLVENPDNYFKVVDDELRVSRSLTSQAIQPSYTIKVRSIDLNGDYIERALVITALSAKIPPQGIYLTHHQVLENSPGGTVVGRLWTQDPKPGHYSYKLLNQTHTLFTIVGDLLLVAPEATLDFETQPTTYTLTVRSQKANTSYHLDQTFTIDLINQIDVTALAPVSSHQDTPISLKLLPDVTHQGQQAKFTSVILWQPSASKETFMYRRDGARWIPWHGELTHLLSGQAVMLTNQLDVTLVLDPPLDWNDGEVTWLAGYQLPTGEIFYTVVPWQ